MQLGLRIGQKEPYITTTDPGGVHRLAASWIYAEMPMIDMILKP